MTDPHPASADGGADRPDGDPDPAVDPAPAAAAIEFACPACGHPFEVAAVPEDGLLACPACGAEFFAAADPSDEDRDLADRIAADRQRREQALNDVRIKQVLTERRSLFRTRSYFVVLAGLALVAAVQFAIFSVQRLRGQGFGPRVAAYLAAVAGLLYATVVCVGRIRFYNRELAEPVTKEPAVEPDFSTLSDGSQRVAEAAANLERLSGRG